MRWSAAVLVMTVGACNSTLEPSLPDVVLGDASAFSVGYSHTLLVDTFGNLVSYGAEVPAPHDADGNALPLGLPLLADVAVGRAHACGLSTTGSVHCWGENLGGALGAHRVCPAGAGTPETDRCILASEIMPTLPPSHRVAAGDDVSCAVTLADDEVVCWGAPNRTGGSRVPALDPPSPVTLPDGGALRVSRLVANRGTLCAIAKTDGALWCWGDGFGLQPVRQPQAGVVDIALGARHSCIIDGAGLACWGDDRNAQVSGDVERARACGDGPCNIAEPLHVALDATRVVVGERHTCALLVDQRVACWGSNEVGQLGRDDAFLVGGIGNALGDATALAAGFAHTCARRFDDSVWCWGGTAFGEE